MPGRWTAEEDAFLMREASSSRPTKELAEELGRSLPAIRQRAKMLGTPIVRRGLVGWDADEAECTVCGETKPRGEFYEADWGHHRMCKACKRRDQTKRWREDVGGYRTRELERLRGNREERLVAYRTYRLRTMFHLTPEQYDAMLQAQGGVCAICKHPETKMSPNGGKAQVLAVDHDRACCSGNASCGKCVRGLLCSECNQLLGKIERRGLLDGIVAYIECYRKPDRLM